MDRPTKELTTPNGNKVVVWEYLTGKDLKAWNKVVFDNVKYRTELVDGAMKPVVEGFEKSFNSETSDKAIEILVVSVDGVKENVRDVLEGLKADDYSYVVEQLLLFFGKTKTE